MNERFPTPEQPDEPKGPIELLASLKEGFIDLTVAKNQQDIEESQRLEQKIAAQLEEKNYPELHELYRQACLAHWTNEKVATDKGYDHNIRLVHSYLRDYLDGRFPPGSEEHKEIALVNLQSKDTAEKIAELFKHGLDPEDDNE